MRKHSLIGLIATLAASVALNVPAQAQSADEFYKGKTLNIVVGASAGGGVDLFARLVARHIGKYIPGNPTVVVQNSPVLAV